MAEDTISWLDLGFSYRSCEYVGSLLMWGLIGIYININYENFPQYSWMGAIL